MEDKIKPRFIESLQRNNDQIREDRAKIIGADFELIYRRRVEDIEMFYVTRSYATRHGSGAYVFPTKKNLVITCLDQIEEKFKVEDLDVKFDAVYGSYSLYSKDFKPFFNFKRNKQA